MKTLAEKNLKLAELVQQREKLNAEIEALLAETQLQLKNEIYNAPQVTRLVESVG